MIGDEFPRRVVLTQEIPTLAERWLPGTIAEVHSVTIRVNGRLICGTTNLDALKPFDGPESIERVVLPPLIPVAAKGDQADLVAADSDRRKRESAAAKAASMARQAEIDRLIYGAAKSGGSGPQDIATNKSGRSLFDDIPGKPPTTGEPPKPVANTLPSLDDLD